MRLKLILSLLVSAVFTYLAFRNIDFALMWRTLSQANYWLLAPGLLFMYVSLWLRALRWGYFMKPIKPVGFQKLFSAMMIGYYGNNVFPFRLGEVLRAYAIGQSAGVSRMASFATIFVERIIDVISLLLLLGVSLLFHDYPAWIEKGGAILLGATVACTVFIVFLMKRTERTLSFVMRLLRPFPEKVKQVVSKLLASFLAVLSRDRVRYARGVRAEQTLKHAAGRESCDFGDDEHCDHGAGGAGICRLISLGLPAISHAVWHLGE